MYGSRVLQTELTDKDLCGTLDKCSHTFPSPVQVTLQQCARIGGLLFYPTESRSYNVLILSRGPKGFTGPHFSSCAPVTTLKLLPPNKTRGANPNST